MWGVSDTPTPAAPTPKQTQNGAYSTQKEPRQAHEPPANARYKQNKSCRRGRAAHARRRTPRSLSPESRSRLRLRRRRGADDSIEGRRAPDSQAPSAHTHRPTPLNSSTHKPSLEQQPVMDSPFATPPPAGPGPAGTSRSGSSPQRAPQQQRRLSRGQQQYASDPQTYRYAFRPPRDDSLWARLVFLAIFAPLMALNFVRCCSCPVWSLVCRGVGVRNVMMSRSLIPTLTPNPSHTHTHATTDPG